MDLKYKGLFLMLGLVYLFSSISAQGFLRTNGKAIVGENGDTIIVRAMGLGGWMVQEGYMLQTSGFANAQHEIREKIGALIGPQDTELFYAKWLENSVRKTDIDSLASWGFNAVRLPMHYNLYTLPIEEEPVLGQQTWLNTGFELTDSLVSWCRQNHMYVLLDLHAAPGGQGYESAISDYDPDKPSLWESAANRTKTVALWKKLAARYADEPWIMGYDLINEPNWNLPGGTALRSLYREITDAIREVDTKHIIFIEGNWFANDFTGLTPPWDNNMAYSPHKYWSKNETADIQWVLTIRDQYNVPIYFGESGENSNVWFTDAIRLLENEGIGWAWWPLKKVESISCPLSIVKTPEYEYLLNYWNGNGPKPSAALAKTTLLEFAENLKTENCVYQKDVIDAMFRQIRSTETIPYAIQNIPGIIYASDFSMGNNGVAYFDVDVADYHVTTGNYTAWNNGWVYRNDGVDIEKIQDNVNSNGYGIGWINTQEWMQYDVSVEENAVYDIRMRYASNSDEGTFHLESEGAAPFTAQITPPNTNGWYNWQSFTIPDVILTTDMKKIRFYADKEGFNLSSFEFIKKSGTEEIETKYLSSRTQDNETVSLFLNKPIASPLPAGSAGFLIRVNGWNIPITGIKIHPDNPRMLNFAVDHTFKAEEVILISYLGNEVMATDGTPLTEFILRQVLNTVENFHNIPGKIEAEDYFYQLGVQLEACEDVGGGQNIGYLDPGDYLEYYVNVKQAGFYKVDYRTAAESAIGQIELQLVDEDGNKTSLHKITLSPTGGWQNWRLTSKEATLPAGKFKIRLEILKSPFNLNWFEFSFLSTGTESENSASAIQIFPNPTQGLIRIAGIPLTENGYTIEVSDIRGEVLLRKTDLNIDTDLPDLVKYPDGIYMLKIYSQTHLIAQKKIVKMGER